MRIKFYIGQGLRLILAFLRMRNYRFYKFPYKDQYLGKKAYILVNGPSLKKAFEEYDREVKNGVFPSEEHIFAIDENVMNKIKKSF